RVRFGLHRVAIDQQPAHVEVVAADLVRSSDVMRQHDEDLMMSVKLLARRRDGQAALAPLLREAPVELRRVIATALCRIYTKDASLQAALEAAQMDEDQ